jgi:bacteriophage N4 adsorption protein A
MRYPLAFNHPHKSLSLLLLTAALLLTPGHPAAAAQKAPAYQPDAEYYLNRIAAAKPAGYLQEVVRRYRSYPRLDLAYRLQRAGRLPEARREFEDYLALVPEDVRSRMSYLVLLDALSLPAEVVAQADLILSRLPGFVPAAFYQGVALQKLGQTDRAFAVFATAAQGKELLKKDRVFALATAADLAISRQRYAEAGQVLAVLTAIEKKASWYQKLGVVLEKSDHPKEALDAYAAAGELATLPGEKVAASLALAEVARKLNLAPRATQAYATAFESDPGNQAALRGLAELAYQGGRYQEAEKWLKLLMKLDGARPADRKFLANLYLKQKDYAAAIPELKALLQQQGTQASADSWLALAQAYDSAGRPRESAATYQALLRRAPANAEAQLRYGSLLVRLQKFEEAGPLLKKASTSGLSDAEKVQARTELALVYEKSGSFENAARELESLPGQQRDTGEHLVQIARLLGRAGKSAQALRYLDQALALPLLSDDLKRSAHREKSLLYQKSGESAAAVAELEKSFRPGAPIEPRDCLSLGILLKKAGRPAEALGYLDQALAAPSLTKELRLAALREKGELLEQGGNPEAAALEYETAVALGDHSPASYLYLANLYQASAKPERAIGYLDLVARNPAATKSESCSAADGLGMSYFKLGRDREAASHFSAALKECGESWQRHYYLGLAHYRTGEPALALEQFSLSQAQKSDPAALLGMALCHKDLGRPGASVHYLQLALQEPGSATASQLKQINDTLGYLYADEFAYDKAAQAFGRSLAGSPDNTVSLKLATVYQLAGRADQSRQALHQVDSGKLSLAETVQYNDLQSELWQKEGRVGDALALMEQTQKLQPSASRSYGMGVLSQNAGRRQDAIRYFQDASLAEPQQDEYASALGYACASDGRLADAIKAFQGVAERNPDDVKVREELGYLYGKLGRNEQAARLFQQALDAFPVLPPADSAERERWEEDAHRMRGEIAKLTRTFSGALYASYRSGKAPSSFLANGEQISGGLNGQLGIEGAYRPPGVGLVNDRILEIFGRVFGNLDSGSLRYNEDSTQAGVGIRYKFLRKENLWLSAEKLIKIGKDAQHDWLLRLLYSRGAGLEPSSLAHTQDYYLIYGEVDGYFPSDTVALYGELRKGRAFSLYTDYLLAPYLALDARWQSPFSSGGNYLEGGAGVSLKYFFNKTRYENYRDIAEFSLSYRHGVFFNEELSRKSGSYDSGIVSVGLFF